MNSTRQAFTIMSSLALVAGLGCMQPASANDALNFLRNALGTGNAGNNASFAQTQTISNLNAQRAQIDARIAAGLSSGRMSPQQANDFRSQLVANNNLQMQYASDGIFTFAEAQGVLSALNSIDTTVQSVANYNAYPGTYPGWNRGRGRGVNLARIDQLQAGIASQLQTGRSDGRLTASEYASLHNELNRLNGRRMQMISSGGRVDRSEFQNLVDRLTSLDSRVQTELRDRQTAGRPRRWY